jgi:hypothetical protein
LKTQEWFSPPLLSLDKAGDGVYFYISMIFMGELPV